MSNLGAYQMVTTGIKAMGGPAKAGLIAVGSVVALTGSVYRIGVNHGVNMGDRQTIEAKVTEWVRSRFAQFNAHELSEVHTVSADVECGGGLMLRAGDRFQVGKVIDDMVYVEVEGSDDNPFIVSAEQLTLHSDYHLLLKEEDGLLAGH